MSAIERRLGVPEPYMITRHRGYLRLRAWKIGPYDVVLSSIAVEENDRIDFSARNGLGAWGRARSSPTAPAGAGIVGILGIFVSDDARNHVRLSESYRDNGEITDQDAQNAHDSIVDSPGFPNSRHSVIVVMMVFWHCLPAVIFSTWQTLYLTTSASKES